MKKYYLIIASLIVIILLFLIGYLMLQKQKSQADIIGQNLPSEHSIYIKLPKELADQVKHDVGLPTSRSFSISPEQKKINNQKIDNLIETEFIKSISTNSKSFTRARSANIDGQKMGKKIFFDAIIFLADENNNIIKKNSRATNNDVPSSNKINFTIDTGWTDEEKKIIQDTITAYYPKIQEIFGPPLFNINLSIVKRGSSNDYIAGYYNSLESEIVINDANPEVIIHEISHAWRDVFIIMKDERYYDLGYEEGLSNALAYLLLGSSYSSFLYEPTNNSSLTEVLRNNLVYDIAWKPFYKLYLEDKNALKKFHNEIYRSGQQPTTKSADTALLKSLANIEGQTVNQWYQKQYILHPIINRGGSFLTPVFNSVDGEFWYYSLSSDGKNSLTIDPRGSENKFKISMIDANNKLITSDEISGIKEPMVSGLNVWFFDVFNPSVKFQEIQKKFNGWFKFTITQSQNKAKSEITGIYGYDDQHQNVGKAPNLAIIFDNPVKFNPDGKLIVKQKINGVFDDTKTKEFSISQDNPSARYGLVADYQDYFERDKYYNINLSYYCPVFGKEKSMVDLGSVILSYYDPIYLQLPTELKLVTNVTVDSNNIKNGVIQIKPNQLILADVTLKQLSGRTIRKIKERAEITSNINQRILWDKKDDLGRIVPSGNYLLEIKYIDKYCNQKTITRTVRI